MTYRECYEKGCLALQTAGIEEATLDARLLLIAEHALQRLANTSM